MFALRFTVVALLLLGACATPDKQAQGDRLTAEEELRPELRDAWRAWYENTEEWPAWRERVQSDERLARFMVDNLVRVMIKFYDHSALANARSMPGYFERARRELVWMGEHSGPVLVELVMVGDGVISFLAGDLLVQIDDVRWTLEIARKLEVDEAEGRRRAAQLLERLPHARKEEAQILERLERAALEDSEWFVRAEAVRAVGLRALAGGDSRLSRRTLSRALSDEDRVVVIEACVRLAELRDLLALPALINLLERLERGSSGDVGLLREVEQALRAISARDGLQGSADWRGWWRENRP